MIARAGRERGFQQAAAIVVAIASAATAPAALPRPPQQLAQADAIVARLRELPLPVKAFPSGIVSRQAARRPLPALESRRQRVYDELHALGPAGVPALARALRDPDAEMRRNAAVALDVLGGGWWHFADGDSRLDLRPALPALVAALADPDAGVRAWAAQDLGDMGAVAAAAVPHLRAMLLRADSGSRAAACTALGRIGSAAREALPDLRRALEDSSPEVRWSARGAIARIGRARH